MATSVFQIRLMSQCFDKAHEGFKICHYKKRDWVRWLRPPKAADILDETPFMGTYKVTRYDECYHEVLL